VVSRPTASSVCCGLFLLQRAALSVWWSRRRAANREREGEREGGRTIWKDLLHEQQKTSAQGWFPCTSANGCARARVRPATYCRRQSIHPNIPEEGRRKGIGKNARYELGVANEDGMGP